MKQRIKDFRINEHPRAALPAFKSFETADFAAVAPTPSDHRDSYAHLTNSMLEDRINEIKRRIAPPEDPDRARVQHSKLFQKFI